MKCIKYYLLGVAVVIITKNLPRRVPEILQKKKLNYI